MGSLALLSWLAIARLLQIYIFTGGPVLVAKIGLAGPILVAKVVWGTSFCKIFFQNWSSWTDFGGTNFGVTGHTHLGTHRLCQHSFEHNEIILYYHL